MSKDSIRTCFEDVAIFHEKFGIRPTTLGNQLNPEQQLFRINTMLEELHEYVNAISSGNYEMALDSLVDLVWFALGTSHVHGLDFDEAWKRVREANMAKIRATDTAQSKRGYKKDIVKPIGWLPADLQDLVAPPPSKEEYLRAILAAHLANVNFGGE